MTELLTPSVLLGALMIFGMRIVDVSLGTLRIGMLVRGKRRWAGRFGRFGRDASGGLQVMRDRFGHAPEHQPNAHTRAKQHGKPRQGGKFWLVVVFAQFDLAVTPKSQITAEQQKGQHRQQVIPAEIGRGGGDCGTGRRAKTSRTQQPPDHK